MDILLTINDLYVNQALTLINSIFINNNGNINIHIIHCGELDSKNIDKMNDFISYRGGSLRTYCVNIEWINGLFMGPWGKTVMLKFYAWEILKDIDKVLYLDGDTLVIGSLKELWDLELDGKYLATPTGTADSTFIPGIEFANYYLKREKTDFHINAGVLLFNLKELRKADLGWREFYRENFKRFVVPDEQLILSLCRDKILPINIKWSYETTQYKEGTDIRILHYAIKKPWVTFCGPYHDLYLKYCKLSECREFYLQNVKNVQFFPIQFPILETWLVFEMDHSDFFERFFRDKGYRNVAVYGVGRMGKLFTYKNNKVHAVDIKYYLDAYNSEQSFLGKELIKPEALAIKGLEERSKEIDAIIVTPIDEFYEINIILKEIYPPKINIVSVVEIICY